MFLTALNLARNPGPDKWWRVQQYLRFSWSFHGRKRTCYRLGMRYVHKSLMYSTIGRQVKKQQMKWLWGQRIHAAAQEHGLSYMNFMEGLARSHVQLDRKVLADMAMYEPRSFQSLVEVSKRTLAEDGLLPPTPKSNPGYLKQGSTL